MNTRPTERFSGRVVEYARYRPAFPGELIDRLTPGIIAPSSIAADIGSGTGIFSRQLAPLVGTLYCVEPNREMREYSMDFLRKLHNVRVSAGSAEDTGLPGNSIDVITAAQAFHWFDRERTKTEFRRILKAGGSVVLLWYDRVTSGEPFLEGYEALLQEHSIDYREVDHRNVTPEVIRDFFHPNPVTRFESPMTEEMNLATVRGRISSSSYTPPPGHPNHAALMAGVGELFRRCRRAGTVTVRYRVSASVGSLTDVTAPAAGPPAGNS